MTRVPAASASMFKHFEWPAANSVEAYSDLSFNCFRYELSDGAHSVVSTDAMGIYADGNSPEDAIVEFRLAVKTRISGGLGGLYFGQSDFVYQEKEFLGLEKEWLFDMSTEEVVSTWDFTATYTHVLKEVGIGSKFP